MRRGRMRLLGQWCPVLHSLLKTTAALMMLRLGGGALNGMTQRGSALGLPSWKLNRALGRPGVGGTSGVLKLKSSPSREGPGRGPDRRGWAISPSALHAKLNYRPELGLDPTVGSLGAGLAAGPFSFQYCALSGHTAQPLATLPGQNP